MFKEDSILLKIQSKSLKTYTKNRHLAHLPLRTNYEDLRVLPHYINLKIFMRAFHVLKPALRNLNNNICFLDIHEKYENIKIGCDWCSICNGVVETVKQNINDDPELLKEIDVQKTKFVDKYLDFVLNYRKNKIPHSEIEEWCNNTFHKKNKRLVTNI